MAKLSDEFIFDYFSQLNPIAYKIQAEINQAIENYEHYWNELDKREQMTIINEAVIKPEIKLNYHRRSKKADEEPVHPYRDIDASLLNYFVPRSDVERPFSYKTRSQENLFYSFNPGDEEPITSAVRLPVAKPKNHQINKSTDSLTCVNFVSLNVKAKKGRAPAVPTKMTTKPPPPPPPTTKAAKPKEAPKCQAPPPPVAVPVPVPIPEAVQENTQPLEDIPKIPEDSNSNTSLLSPADELEANTNSLVTTEPSDDEFKSLLDSTGFDFLNNW